MEMIVMPLTEFTPAKARPLTDIEFCAWIGQAMPGDRLEYHRGFLGIDTTAVISTLPGTTSTVMTTCEPSGPVLPDGSVTVVVRSCAPFASGWSGV